MIWPNGLMYKGGFKNRSIDGDGKLYMKDGGPAKRQTIEGEIELQYDACNFEGQFVKDQIVEQDEARY